jgi:hypothetical protein
MNRIRAAWRCLVDPRAIRIAPRSDDLGEPMGMILLRLELGIALRSRSSWLGHCKWADQQLESRAEIEALIAGTQG